MGGVGGVGGGSRNGAEREEWLSGIVIKMDLFWGRELRIRFDF